MAAPLSVDRPPSPDTSGEIRSSKARPGEGVAAHRRAEPSERKRLHLDSLAIGAPLTAAFIGGLLAEGQILGGDDALAGAGEGTAVAGRDGSTTDSIDGASAGGLMPGITGVPELMSGEAAPGSTATFDPVTTKGGGGGERAAVSPAETAASLPLAESSAATVSNTEASGAVEVNLTLGGPGVDLEGASEAVDGGASGLDPIGTFVAGGVGDDVIVGTELADQLIGGAGDDQIQGLAGNDLLDGGSGDDLLLGGTGDDRLLGGTGDDQLLGGVGDDALLGGAGDDLLSGNAGIDRLDGGAGNDLLDGGSGNDQLRGGTGDDVLVVDALHDVARENARGADGGGIDVLQVEDGFAAALPAGTDSATFVFSDNIGGDLPGGINAYRQQVSPDIEHMTLNGSADHDVVGDGLNNQLTGNAGDNALFGGAGDDLLDGGAGRDRLDGGVGDDLLTGGTGGDSLVGGTGADVLHGGRR